MPPNLRCKSVKSTEIRSDLRKSSRKRKVPEKSAEKTPKRRGPTSVKTKEESTPTKIIPFASVNTPSTSFSSDNTSENTCAFYRTRKGDDGKPIFSGKLLKYFFTVDSPEMDDLKKKRFNTSFIREIPRDRSSLEIFSEEERENHDSFKLLENVPKLNCNMPDVPGSGFYKVFQSMPIGDSDEELKKKTLCVEGKHESRMEKRKSTRCTEFKGKPLPDQALAVDYTSLLDSESSSDDNPEDQNETEMERNEQETALPDAVSDNKNSILLTLLSAPVEEPIKPYTYSGLQTQPSYCCNISSTVEDKMLLNKYKDIMGDKQVNVVLTRLPIEAQLLELGEGKKLNLKSANEEKKKFSEVSKYNRLKKIKTPKVRLCKLQKKNHGNTEP